MGFVSSHPPCVWSADDCGRPVSAIGNMGRATGDEDLKEKAAVKGVELHMAERQWSHVADRGACHVSPFQPNVLCPSLLCLCGIIGINVFIFLANVFFFLANLSLSLSENGTVLLYSSIFKQIVNCNSLFLSFFFLALNHFTVNLY